MTRTSTRRDAYRFAGGIAVVTGAAGGIGEQLARQLAMRGSHLALADRRGEPLTALAAELAEEHPLPTTSTGCCRSTCTRRSRWSAPSCPRSLPAQVATSSTCPHCSG